MTDVAVRHVPLVRMSTKLPRSLRLRAAVAWAAIALALATVLAVSSYAVTRRHLVAEREEGAIDRAYVDARALRTALHTPGTDVTQILSGLGANAGATSLAHIDGEWFSASVDRSPEQLPADVTSAVRDQRAAHQRVRLGNDVHLVIGVPIASQQASYFEIVPMHDIDGVLGGLRDRLALTGVAAAALAAVVGWYASGRALSPLRRVAAAAGAIADGRLDVRMPESADSDLRVIERAFNRMADSVQQRIDREARFTSDVSHELRSPVAAMLSAINVARRADGRAGVTSPVLDSLEERAQLLHRTVEDLLEISRVEAGVATLDLAPIDPVKLVHAVLDRMNADVPVVAPHVIPNLALDKRRMAQLVQNLVDNASRYAGGATGIEVHERDGLLRIAVEDAGPGVTPSEREHVFERFARGAAARESGASGTGLGLALVAEHAALHDGSVYVEDAPSGGCRFIVELPARRPW
jgi:signal transduction histidine kinase